MVIVEALLFTCMLAVMATASYSDAKRNVIPNKKLLTYAIPAVVLDVVYYAFFGRDYLILFLLNCAVLSAVGIVFYAYALWAAGDCKLLITIGLCVPGRFYSFWGSGIGVSFYIVAFTFSLAFVYLMGESLVLGIRNRELFRLSFEGFSLKGAVISYFSMVGALTLISIVLDRLFPAFYSGSSALPAAINFLLVLTLIRLRDKVNTRTLLWGTVALWIGLIALSIFHYVDLRFGGSILSWGIVLLVMLLRLFADKYNYKVIPTSEVKRGYILSAMTVMSFQLSRVHGLPTSSTEDLRSRLTEEEAESVRRWESSASGKPYVVIVRKIPFAIFISVGTLLFLVFEVAMI